ncbi:TPM domain-containing protein [Candidatus Acetothermia bacterium]|nr:TPM domain-containing protein [Candidatus Acetothermia bacterium]MBI3642914.1 TPM domain-containing protein [Candidatus Acetothermia bacterium]
MTQSTKILICCAVSLLVPLISASRARAQDAPKIPDRVSYVSDYADAIRAKIETDMNQTLQNVKTSLGLTIDILVVPTANSVPIEQYGQNVLKAWGIDKQNKDEKTLLFVLALKDGLYSMVKTAGLEKMLTDDTLQEIGKDAIIPELSQGHIESGIAKMIQRVVSAYSDALRSTRMGTIINAPPATDQTSKPGGGMNLADLLGLGIAIALIVVLAWLNHVF